MLHVPECPAEVVCVNRHSCDRAHALPRPLRHDRRRLARRIAATPALREWNGGELTPGAAATSDDDLREFVRGHVHTIHHPVGTCGMGTARTHDGRDVMIGEKAADLVRAA